MCMRWRPLPLAVDGEGDGHMTVVLVGWSTPGTRTTRRGHLGLVEHDDGNSRQIQCNLGCWPRHPAVYLGPGMQGIECVLGH